MIQEKKVQERIKRFLKFFLGFPLTIVSLFFILRFVYSGKDEILSQITNFNILPFSLGILFLIIFFFLGSYTWKYLLANEGYDVGIRESTYNLATADIRRYIPGKILSYVSRVYNFKQLNVPEKVVVKLILYEIILFIIASSLISIPASLYFFPKLASPILGGAVVLMTLAAVFFKKIKTNLNLLEIPFWLNIVSWVFYGLGNYLVATSFVYIDPSKILHISSFFVASWLAGYIVLIVPMGLGIREGVTTLGLSSLMPVAPAASIALITRITLVLSELLFLVLSFIFYKLVMIKHKVKNHILILWVSIVSYISYFTYYSFEKHANFFTGRFDLGNMDQTVWNTLNGRIFQMTNPDGMETISRLAFHADFILVLLAPFYLIWEDPRMLLLIQAVVLGIGSYFVYLIAHRVIKSTTIATIMGISYLLNPFVQKQNLFDFHAIVLSTTFLLAAFYFMLGKRYKLFLLSLALAMLTKENIFLIASVFGLYLTFKTKDKRWLILTIGGIASFYFLIDKLIPLARGSQHFATEYFQEFGNSPVEILINLASNPFKTLSSLFAASNLPYIYKLFIPVGFLSFLSPLALLFAFSDLAINLLSKNENLRTLTFHYGATIIPFVYISAIFAIEKVLRLKLKLVSQKSISYFLIIFAIYGTYQYGVLPGAKNPSLEIYDNYLPQRQDIKKFLENIPQNLSVASTNNLGAHLSHREKIYTIPIGVEGADVVLFLLNDKYASPSLSEQMELARNLQNNTAYIELYKTGDFIAFAKRSAARRIPNAQLSP